MGARRYKAKKKKAKAKPQHKQDNSVLEQVPVSKHGEPTAITTRLQVIAPTVDTTVHTLIVLGTIGGILAGVFIYYQKQSPLVWTVFTTICMLFLAACLKWRGKARWVFWVSAVLITFWACTVWQTRIWTEESIQSQKPNPQPQQPQLDQPTFRGNTEKVTLTFGHNDYGFMRDDLKHGIGIPALVGPSIPIRVYSENDKIYADVTISGGFQEPIIELKRNVFTVKPMDWDYNSSDKAFEVINQRGVPVFQIIYRAPSRLLINGVFPVEGGVVFASKDGLLFNRTPPGYPTNINPKGPGYTIRRIFKYPSWQHPGEYDPLFDSNENTK